MAKLQNELKLASSEQKKHLGQKITELKNKYQDFSLKQKKEFMKFK
ncbi:hypothetical protein NW062_02330 [Mycoplasmopsis cynos]|nr:hypothetical protein NW062_02330 [Mycoplasmopsis cynos]